jgi:hypothetical protein
MNFNLIMSNALSASGWRRTNAAALIHTLDSDLRTADFAPKPLVRPAGGQQFRCFRGIAGHLIVVVASRDADVGGAPAGPAVFLSWGLFHLACASASWSSAAPEASIAASMTSLPTFSKVSV